MSEFVDLSIKEAGSLLRRREVSAVELCEATLERIEATEPVVHAFEYVAAEGARRDAALADREIRRGIDKGPLHGIPVNVKDLFYTKDMPSTGSSKTLEGFVPDFDSTPVTRLRHGGAVLVGKVVGHEFGYGINKPVTRSPWKEGYYPGGSSAGSGVSVSVRSSYASLGTDTLGSIRVPGSVANIVGLVPTFGRVGRAGVMPLSFSLDTVGPLTRTVADSALVLQVIAGFDPADGSSARRPVPNFSDQIGRSIKGVTVGVDRAYFWHEERVRPYVAEAADRVLEDLKAAGVKVVEFRMAELDLVIPAGVKILVAEAAAMQRRMLRDRIDDYDEPTRTFLRAGELLPATHYLTAQRVRRVLRDRMRSVFEQYGLDVVVSPTITDTAVPVEQMMEPGEGGLAPLFSYIHQTAPTNLTGQPAVSVPAGFVGNYDLPIGVQFFGRPFDEPTLLAVADSYERIHRWWDRRPPLTP